jgi:uncharacterized membrane protein
MRARLSHAWEVVRTSFWFVPLIMAILATVLAIVMLEVDDRIDKDFHGEFGWLYSRGKEGSRELLGVVAGSMITVAGLAFSIIVVALQLASSQFGPRLLRTFMRDLGNQVVLGTFTGTFIYCLLVMRTIGDTDGEEAPHLAVTVAVVLAVAGIGVLIYFIHHAARMMQAPNVIASVSHELREALDRAFPAQVESPHSLQPVDGAPADAVIIGAPGTGYIQAFDYRTLADHAEKDDIQIQLMRRPGQFVTERSALALAWPRERVRDAIDGALQRAALLGHQRSPEQDPEFAIDQLVEVALRALSPSLNDPFTAVAAIDHLTGAITPVLANGGAPITSQLVEGRPRVVLATLSIDGLLDAAFHKIRQAAGGSAMVTIRLIEALGTLAVQARTVEAKASVRRHLEYLASHIDAIGDDNGRADARGRYTAALVPLEPSAAGELSPERSNI